MDIYNVKIHTKFQSRSIQDVKVTGNEHQVNMTLNEINNIATYTNYFKLVSAIFIKFLFFYQMIALQKL